MQQVLQVNLLVTSIADTELMGSLVESPCYSITGKTERKGQQVPPLT